MRPARAEESCSVVATRSVQGRTSWSLRTRLRREERTVSGAQRCKTPPASVAKVRPSRPSRSAVTSNTHITFDEKGRSFGASLFRCVGHSGVSSISITVSIGGTRVEAQTASTISCPLAKSRRRESTGSGDSPAPAWRASRRSFASVIPARRANAAARFGPRSSQ